MQPIESACKEFFRASTLEELVAYADELKIKLTEKEANDSDKVRKKLLDTLGVVEPAQGPKAERTKLSAKMAADLAAIVPPYNMLPTGKYEGRRHRITLHRPEGAKKENRRSLSVNGFVKEMRYDQVESVPDPIYCLMRDNMTVQPDRHEIYDGRHIERITTRYIPMSVYNYTYHGVDPETATRCGSVLEWYQQKGPEWFAKLTPLQLRRVAQVLDVRTTMAGQDGKTQVPLPERELRYSVNTFVFSENPMDNEDVAA